MSETQPAQLSREKGSFISHVATLAAGTAVSQGINILAMLVLTRIFAPQAFGLLALFMTCVTLFSVLGGARYELAIMLPEEDTEAVNVFYGSVFALLAISLFGLVSIAVFHARITRLLGDPEVAPWLWSMPVVLFLMGLYQVLSYWCGRMKRFQKVAVSRVALTVGTVVAQVGLFLLHFSGGISLIGGWIIGQSTGTAVLLAQVVRRDGRFLLRHAHWNSVPGLLKTYRNFPLYKAPYSFISNAASQLVVVVIRFFSDLMTVGLFSLSFRAISIPVSLITGSMNQVFYEKAARESDTVRLQNFVDRVLYIQVVLMTPMLVLAAFEAKLLFVTFFGARWAMSGQFASWLAFAGYMYFLSSWLDRLFDIQGRQRLSLALEIGGNLMSLGALAAALYFTKNAVVAVACFTVSEVLYTVVWLYASYRVARFRTSKLLRIAWAFCTSAVPLFLVIGAIHLALPGWSAFAVSLSAVILFEFVYSLPKVRADRSVHTRQEPFRGLSPNQNSPAFSSEIAQSYRDCRAHLRGLFPDKEFTRALAVSCGDGSTFSFLELPSCSCTGLDFNSRLLEGLRSRSSGIRMSSSDESSFLEDRGFCDLLFSHSVVQHCDPTGLSKHFRDARAMMRRDSVLICGSLLDKKRRRCAADTRKNFRCYVALARSSFRRLLGLDRISYCYDRAEFSAIARLNGFEASFVASSVNADRFHAVLQLTETGSPGRRQKVSPPDGFFVPVPTLGARTGDTQFAGSRPPLSGAQGSL